MRKQQRRQPSGLPRGTQGAQKKQGWQLQEGCEQGPLVDLGELVVNLKDPTDTSYLKVKANLELDSETTRPEVEGRFGSIRYALTVLLSGQRPQDVEGPAARRLYVRR